MTPADLEILRQHLDRAAEGLQRLEKRLRQFRNKGHVADADVVAAKQALELLRAIYARHSLGSLDIDSRAERDKPQ